MNTKQRRILLVLLGIGFVAFFMSHSAPPLPEEHIEIPVVDDTPNTVTFFPDILSVERPPELFSYVEVKDSCGPHYEGECLNVRNAPTATGTSALLLRTGVVLPVEEETLTDTTGREWYKIHFREWIRYPERISGDLFVAAEFVELLKKPDEKTPIESQILSTKRIVIDRSEQKLYAYEGDELVMEVLVSTGLDFTPTPRGSFTVLRKTPSRYMQGPLPGISSDYYDLPGVPWNLYFTQEGGAIHGAYWHNSFGAQWSHGCVNLPLDMARQLYDWTPVGTSVLVRD